MSSRIDEDGVVCEKLLNVVIMVSFGTIGLFIEDGGVCEMLLNVPIVVGVFWMGTLVAWDDGSLFSLSGDAW